MNGIYVGPEQLRGADSRTRYFEDCARLGIDYASITCHGDTYDDVADLYKNAYLDFVKEARRRGCPSCINIHLTACAGDKVGVEEAQYNLKNKPEQWDEKRFLASFSSDAWRNYVKELTTLFVRDYGFDWVVFEEPVSRVDIPGTNDRFHKQFCNENPNIAYPQSRSETTAYLLVQQAKADALISFCTDLVEHAVSMGAKKVGLMPSSFIPSTQNTPEGTLNTSCDVGRMAQIPGVDFLVTQMNAENIRRGVYRTGDELEKSPLLMYSEVMAHTLGKDIIAIYNPGDEMSNNAALAALAAAPTGFTRRWSDNNDDKNKAGLDILTEVGGYIGRLGQAQSPVAFVVSASGLQHAEPLTYETVFQHYWAAAKKLTFDAHLPMLTFHGDTLEQNLAQHPEVQVLVFDEHFPLSAEQITVIREWWQGPQRRAVVAFSSGLGFAVDPSFPGMRPCTNSLPGVLELIGLRQEEKPQFEVKAPLQLRDVSRVKRSTFLGEDLSLNVDAVANTRRVFGSRATILYEIDGEEAKIPVVAEWCDKTSQAIFCGFALSGETAAAAAKAIRYAIKEVDAPGLWVDKCGEDLLWGFTSNGYIVVSNPSDKASEASIKPGRCLLWDSKAQKLLQEGDVVVRVEPHSFELLRVVGRRSKFYDLIGVSSLHSIIDGAGRAEISVLAGQSTTLVLRASPKDIKVDGKASTITQQVINGAYHVTLQQCQPGERKITLRW